MAFEVGQRIGDYEILSLLGAGGMGRVYCVKNVISDRVDAMKVLLPNFIAEPELAARFTAEIRVLASFDHPNIAQLRTAFQYENQLVMVMEFVEGTTLEKRAAAGALPVDEVLEYASQMLSALSYAHGHGVVHRDIKPANMMVTSHGIIKLMDFGIAKSTNEVQLTQPGTTMGSVYYMSPEQVRGATVDARSDLYSVGVTLYELLTGSRPFQADTAYSVLNAQLNEQPKPPVELNPSLPPALNSIILTALSKNPEERFQSAEAFRNALSSVSKSWAATTPALTPVPAESGFAPVPAIQAESKPAASGSHRGLWIGLGAAAAVLAMVAAATILPHFVATHAKSGANEVAASTPPSISDSGKVTPSVPPSGSGDHAASAIPPAAPETAPPAGSTETRPPMQPAANASPTAPFKAVGSGARSPQVPSRAPRPDLPPASAVNSVAAEQPPQPAGPSRQEMDQASERFLQLTARSSATREAIEHIKSQQEASGYGMRTDVTGSLGRMNAYLQTADRAIAANDPEAAQKAMEKAEKEVVFLEHFLGK